MAVDLRGRSFLKLLDFTPEEIRGLLALAAELKVAKRAGIRERALDGLNIALLFEKPSTRTRCAFTVIPKSLNGTTKDGGVQPIHSLWNRRHSTKFNGVSYPVQRGAAAAYSSEGKSQIAGLISFYMNNARLLREGLATAGFHVYGGVNAPYVWVKTPGTMTSWEFGSTAFNS